MRIGAVVVAVVAGLTVSAIAAAEETAPGTVTLPTTVVYGRVQRPSVVLEVRRIEPWVAVRDVSRPAIAEVGDATKRAPF